MVKEIMDKHMLYLGSDHAGFRLKSEIKKLLEQKNISFKDLTPRLDSSDDYPDAAKRVGETVVRNKSRGVLVCGTGMGVCIAANKIKGVRAALVYSEETGRLAKEHNDANIVCFGGRTMEIKDVSRYILAWLDAEYLPEERHKRRIAKIGKLR